MYGTNTGWCVVCWKMLHVVRWDLRRVPYSSTLCNSSCIAAFLVYSCSCQTIQTSITELLLIRNSFELILVYSCPVCTSKSSHGCFILCHCHCQALGTCEGLQTLERKTVFMVVEQFLWPLFFQNSSKQSQFLIHAQAVTTMPASLQGLTLFCLCAFSDAKSCWVPRRLISLSFIFTCARLMCCLFLQECNI